MELLQLALLAVASAFWPILIAVDLIALRTPRPTTILAWFLAAGLLTTIAEGLVIVFVLDGTRVGSSSRSVGGWGNLIGGISALLAAVVLRSRAARTRREPPRAKQKGGKTVRWAEHAVGQGGRYAFGAGIVLNLFPGIFPLVALRNIAASSYGDGAKTVLVVGFYLVMFALVEAPLVGLLLAPERIEPSVQRLNDWLDRHGKQLGIDVLGLIGLFLVVRGIVQLASS
jgi:hypothetical protein